MRTYLDFLMDYAPYFYYLPDSGTVDPEWGRGPAPAAFATNFLSEAHEAREFHNEKSDIYDKIVELADYLLSIHCSDPAKLAYGGFQSKDGSDYYYSVDAMRAITALLKAYDLTEDAEYFDAAELAGGTFIYNMQHKPSELGVHDKYYGGFARAVTIDDDWIAESNPVVWMTNAGITVTQGVKFTQQTKEELATYLKQRMAQGKFKLPYDSDLIAELNIERFELTKSGRINFGHPSATNDDRFWALALAVFAAHRREPEPYFGLVPR